MTSASDIRFVCIPDAIPAAQRAAHFRLAETLFRRTCDRREELPDGLAFRFPASAYADLAAFVGNERLCCPALRFEIELGPASGPVWLRLRGPEGVKEFIAAELPVSAAGSGLRRPAAGAARCAAPPRRADGR